MLLTLFFIYITAMIFYLILKASIKSGVLFAPIVPFILIKEAFIDKKQEAKIALKGLALAIALVSFITFLFIFL